jgi:hypothetical protein
LSGQAAQRLRPGAGSRKDDNRIPTHYNEQFVAGVRAKRLAGFARNNDLV